MSLLVGVLEEMPVCRVVRSVPDRERHGEAHKRASQMDEPDGTRVRPDGQPSGRVGLGDQVDSMPSQMCGRDKRSDQSPTTEPSEGLPRLIL